MGYFSNGTHGDMFEAEHCAQCVHGEATRNPDAKDGCPVWLAHIFFAYEECGTKSNAKHILDLLIEPRDDGMFNECKMFAPTPTDARRQLSMFDGTARKEGGE